MTKIKNTSIPPEVKMAINTIVKYINSIGDCDNLNMDIKETMPDKTVYHRNLNILLRVKRRDMH
jgi:hypothetical protein